MVDRDDEDFFQQFMARVRKREEKLASIRETPQPNSHNDHETEVSYPALSPLPEEGDTLSPSTEIETTGDYSENTTHNNEEFINNDYRRENASPVRLSEMNYSSDLSLECDTINTDTTANEIYRAEPVVCHSPEQKILPQLQLPNNRHTSPRKNAQASDSPHAQLQAHLYDHNNQHHYQQELPTPLQERQQEQKATSSQSLPGSLTDEQIIKDTKRRIEQCTQRKQQLKKAVEVPRYGSKEHIEAAKLLQITDQEHLAYTNYAAMLEKGIRKKSESLGSVKLSNIRLKTSSKLRNDLADESVAHHFFCIVSCGTDVKATDVLNTNDIRRQDLKAYIQFKEKLTFIDLAPDFVVKLEVYELITGHHHTNLLSRLTPSKKSRITPEANFKRVGSLRLALTDRDVSYKNLTQWSKHEESKYIEKECKFQMELRPEQLPSKAGMLDVRCLDSEGRPDWSRFWVDMSDGQIRFWKSNQDKLDGRKPNQLIEMRELCSDFVQRLIPNDGLYRQNSFLIYTYQQVSGGEGDTLFQRVVRDDTKFKVVRHQLAAENKEDRESWCSLLDKSMHSFREWHGRVKVYPLEDLRELFASSY